MAFLTLVRQLYTMFFVNKNMEGVNHLGKLFCTVLFILIHTPFEIQGLRANLDFVLDNLLTHASLSISVLIVAIIVSKLLS